MNKTFTGLIALFLCCFAATTKAQTSCDKLYAAGVKAQQTMTAAAQNRAISSFEKAKVCYDSQSKKEMCDQAIAVSRNIIRLLSTDALSGNVADGSTQENKRVVTKLELSKETFDLPAESSSFKIQVETNQSEWGVTPKSDGNEQFAAATKNGDEIDIYVTKNTSFYSRKQQFTVTAGDKSREITITQNGGEVPLLVSERAINFKTSGGKKQIIVSCAAPVEYQQNFNANWFVEAKPSWISLGINSGNGKKGNSKAKVDGMKDTVVTVQAQALVKGSKEATQGRFGEIVLRSGGSTVTIYITQTAK